MGKEQGYLRDRGGCSSSVTTLLPYILSGREVVGHQCVQLWGETNYEAYNRVAWQLYSCSVKVKQSLCTLVRLGWWIIRLLVRSQWLIDFILIFSSFSNNAPYNPLPSPAPFTDFYSSLISPFLIAKTLFLSCLSSAWNREYINLFYGRVWTLISMLG